MAGNSSLTRSDMEAFIKRVQSLPAELYDHIQDLTLSIDFEKECDIAVDYQPPKMLHIHRALRQLFAQTYYSETKFRFEDPELCTAWLKSLPKQHRYQIRGLKVICITRRGAYTRYRLQDQVNDRFQHFTLALVQMGAILHWTPREVDEDVFEFVFLIDF